MASSPRRGDIILVFFAVATTILSWAAAGAQWASSWRITTGTISFYLAYTCSDAGGCVSYASIKPADAEGFLAGYVNLQGACASFVLSGVATLALAALLVARLCRRSPAASGAALLRLAAAAFLLAMIGTTLPSVALNPLVVNGPGLGLAIAHVVIVTGLCLALALQSRVPAPAPAVLGGGPIAAAAAAAAAATAAGTVAAGAQPAVSRRSTLPAVSRRSMPLSPRS